MNKTLLAVGIFFLSASILTPTTAQAGNADYCVKFIMEGLGDGGNYIQNKCRDKITVTWKDYGTCRGTGCSVDLRSGEDTRVSSLTGSIRYTACFYSDWVNGTCSMKLR